MHRSYVGKIERGKKTPSLETLQKIADALFLPLGALFDRSVNTESEPDHHTGPGDGMYWNVFASSAHPMAVVEADGTVIEVNAAYRETLELPGEEIVERPIWSLESPPASDRLKQIFDGYRPGEADGNSNLSVQNGDVGGRNLGVEPELFICPLTQTADEQQRFLLEYANSTV